MRATNEKKFKVYCHANLTNNKKYIGITCQSLNQRFRHGKGYKNSPKFYHAIQKYGWDNFSHEVLFDNLTREEAINLEIKLIKQYNTTSKDYGYNITPGGEAYCGEEHPCFGKKMSLEARQKMSKARKGISKTEEWKRKIGKSLKGRVFSEETKAKMSKNHPDVTGEKNPAYGRKLSPEHIEMFRRTSHTPEAIAKMKQNKTWYSGKDNPNSKRVMCIENGVVYNTMKEAAEQNNCCPSKVSAVCNGRRNHTNNLHFIFVDEKDIEKVVIKKGRKNNGKI